jgi:hypothetical protein
MPMKGKIVRRSLIVVWVLFVLFVATRGLKSSYESVYGSGDSFVFSTGNAPEDVRSEIVQQLKAFQEGYEGRDTASVDSFMRRLFSPENVLILGTMPREIYVGFEDASDLIFSDWDEWGDCRFLIDNAHISAHGEVAWFATIGHVEFDLSSLLVLPLRLTGVLVREDGIWKLQQVQYQFDLDLGFYLVTILLLIVTLFVSVGVLVAEIFRCVRRSGGA